MSHAPAGTRAVCLLLAFFLAFALPASSQTGQRFSLQVSGLALQGDAALEDWAFGWDAQLRYSPGRLSVGIGVQATQDSYDQVGTDFKTFGPYVEPRYVLSFGDRVGLYGVLRWGLVDSVAGEFFQLPQFGGPFDDDVGFKGYFHVGTGLLVAVTGRVNVDLTGTVGNEGAAARVGLAIGLGG